MIALMPSVKACDQCNLVSTIGSYGKGRLSQPDAVAVDYEGNVYVTDVSSNRVEKFASDGTFLTQWGAAGTVSGEFKFPNGVAVDSTGNVYVLDFLNQRVEKFTSDGNFITQWGAPAVLGTGVGIGPGQFYAPNGIAVDSNGNVYVTDGNEDGSILKFTSDGTFITQWKTYGESDIGRQDNGIAVDSLGNVYVTIGGTVWMNGTITLSETSGRIQKFTNDGTFITQWSEGIENGQFSSPIGVAIDSAGSVYVSDSNYRVVKFDGSGDMLTQWATVSPNPGPIITSGYGIAVDSSGNVYVADALRGRIEKFGDMSEPTLTSQTLQTETAQTVQVGVASSQSPQQGLIVGIISAHPFSVLDVALIAAVCCLGAYSLSVSKRRSATSRKASFLNSYKCAVCGATNTPGFVYCYECGNRLRPSEL
jgi:DNA-binding beta-propeller fold protein YncE